MQRGYSVTAAERLLADGGDGRRNLDIAGSRSRAGFDNRLGRTAIDEPVIHRTVHAPRFPGVTACRTRVCYVRQLVECCFSDGCDGRRNRQGSEADAVPERAVRDRSHVLRNLDRRQVFAQVERAVTNRCHGLRNDHFAFAERGTSQQLRF